MSNTEALRQRLADEADLCRNDGANDIAALLDEARAALAQQPAASGEPVAWVNGAALKSAAVSRERGGPYDLHTWSESRTMHHDTPLTAATAQPAPARVPLTDAQISNMWAHECVRERLTSELVQSFARAIEAAHGITAKAKP